MKKMLEEQCEKYQKAEFDKQIALMNDQLETESKYNAILHILYFLVVLHDEEGIGALRLNRYAEKFATQIYSMEIFAKRKLRFEDFAARNAEFKEKLKDGIAWTYVHKRLSEIGVEISDIDWNMAESMFQKKYEEGVNRTGISVYKER